MLGVRQWRHRAFCVSTQHRLLRRWPRRILMCLFIICESKFTIGESRTIFHANDTQAQQVVPNLRPGRFSTETPLEGERRLQIQREQRTETSTRNRGAEGTSLGTAKATPTTRDRGTGDWNQRHYDRSLSKTHSPPIYVDQSLQSFSSVLYVPNNNRLI